MKIKYGIYVLLSILLFLNGHINKYNNSIIILLKLIALIILTFTINDDFRGGYLYQVLILVLSFFIANRISISTFTVVYCKLIYFFGLISIMVFILAIIFPSIIKIFPVVVNTSGIEKHNLFLAVVHGQYGFGLRNSSIFREPGVFMVYLNIALMLSLFYNKVLEKKHILVYILCLITSFSTAGVIVGASILFLAIFYDKTLFSKREKKIIYTLPVLFVFFIIFNTEVNDSIFNKLNKNSDKYISALSRIASFFVPVNIFIEAPLFGVGLSKFSSSFESEAITSYGVELTADGTATNTLMNKFATYGFLFGSVFMLGIFNFVKKVLRSNIFFKYLFFLIFLAILSNEDMRYSLFFNVIFFYGFIIKRY
ncbi:O-antigen ligase family protein [Tenacibaculum sp. E3R01]|uniref:O-antigen ligase family protein n=1 Tax=Tenacibaculum sp. E3R01 TaxID=2267227 RepID=UPI001314E7EF|nr:O-antigen ligase family protein [Tenacibaculum sp. E3R01]